MNNPFNISYMCDTLINYLVNSFQFFSRQKYDLGFRIPGPSTTFETRYAAGNRLLSKTNDPVLFC